MPQPSKIGRPEAQGEEPAYPPCLFSSQAEKKIYQRLKEVFMANYNTWDGEACDAWPCIVEHASRAPSTVDKLTNHWIARNMVTTKVTWAHVVALRVIYKGKLFKSRKIMGLIRQKYPKANFTSYAYSEEYTKSFKVEEESRQRKTAQKGKRCAAPVIHDSREDLDDPMIKVPIDSLQVSNKTLNKYHNNEEKPQPVEEPQGLYFTRIEPPAVPIKEEEETHSVTGEGKSDQRIVLHSSSKRKRATSENVGGEDGNSLAENTRALEQNTRALKRNTELLERLVGFLNRLDGS
ncbi:hypothetical protein V8C42DRAFT_358200 [Trichoderma barbatum]